jgi:hypothetical protein
MDLYGCSGHLGGGDHVPVCAGQPRSYVDVVLAVMARANAHGPARPTPQKSTCRPGAAIHFLKCLVAFKLGQNHNATTCPHIPFERYADDAICHCKSAKEAHA